MTFAVAAFLSILFALSLRLSGIVSVCVKVLTICRSATTTFLDAQRSDLQKEQAARAAACVLLGALLEIAARLGAAALPPVILVWLLDLSGALRLDELLARLQTWPVILLGAAAMLVPFMIGK